MTDDLSLKKQNQDNQKIKILITGSAGFIGFHLTTFLLKKNFEVVGIDSINSYYDVQLKHDRLKQNGIDIVGKNPGSQVRSSTYNSYFFYQADLKNQEQIEKIFEKEKPVIVINLAAQAGVRYSLTHPREYIKSNIDGFLNILECCRFHGISHLIYASSSSVYGLNSKLPFRTDDAVDHPISLYAATKKSNELMAHTYSYLYGIPTTGLRFFTVYGPWGRPDMAYFLFAKAILSGEPIKLFSNGEMIRDFTFINDIVKSIYLLLDKAPEISDDKMLLASPSSSIAPYRLLNIGNNSPIHLNDFLHELEWSIGKKAIIKHYPMQAGDVKSTHADISGLSELIGYTPNTSVRDGIRDFVEWYRKYYRI